MIKEMLSLTLEFWRTEKRSWIWVERGVDKALRDERVSVNQTA